ncbi:MULTISPECIES: helix-turn-helix domain-containing protein [Micromonospora]|uniref:LuxR family transcriptional regulator n=1 Tax=Micromonospora solifontis TaxID=2487138 RepID=A0ABX9WME7_9ACTN|nr:MULTISPECIES: helix-turn-helix domain-containing protein [Micromonospora]NES13224.1 LuxR family transcriptional regulator [Micromonospora sp. PPF5-17B]NES34593.1 LuxR family transcriptional regulator [Micromonospora solifontis]NES57043.1 LuxR family transcriptional regulator [Micromonospora sp. PPF5-6]RNM01845.1 LuxR family transcriptional regulator [Micromonospora solifontis]
MLEAVGVEPDEEQVYLALAARPAGDAEELSERTGLPGPAVRGALAGLAAKGLVDLPADQADVIRAAPPDPSLKLLALRRMDELRRAQTVIAELAERFHARDAWRGTEAVEVVRGSRAIAERYGMLQREATQEICSLVRRPAVAVPASNNIGQRDALRAGVRYRVVYDRDLLDPASAQIPLLLEEWAALGEEMRVASVPYKIAIFDRRRAVLVPPDAAAEEPVVFLIHARPLVDCLAWIVDRIWESALPVPVALSEATDGSLATDDRRLLALLLAGYTDQAIGSQLGVSMRTVQRRVQRLLTVAGVQSRIQLGWQAARREWI